MIKIYIIISIIILGLVFKNKYYQQEIISSVPEKTVSQFKKIYETILLVASETFFSHTFYWIIGAVGLASLFFILKFWGFQALKGMLLDLKSSIQGKFSYFYSATITRLKLLFIGNSIKKLAKLLKVNSDGLDLLLRDPDFRHQHPEAYHVIARNLYYEYLRNNNLDGFELKEIEIQNHLDIFTPEQQVRLKNEVKKLKELDLVYHYEKKKPKEK